MNPIEGFLYSNGTWTTLNDPSAADGITYAMGINDAGQIVGYYLDSSGVPHGFLYSNGTWTTLDDPSAVNGTIADGMNASGQIVGSYNGSSGYVHGFLYSNGTWTTLDDPSGIGDAHLREWHQRFRPDHRILTTAVTAPTGSSPARHP